MIRINDRTPMPTTGLVGSQRRVPAGRVGAIYDLVVTAAFATPWTAALVTRLLANAHDSLGLPGSDMPQFETSHMLYVTLFGIVVTMWSVVRILRPIPLLIAADTVGRAAFALAFLWALAEGHSTVIVGFLVLEVAFLAAQWLGLRKALAADKRESDVNWPQQRERPVLRPATEEDLSAHVAHPKTRPVNPSLTS